MKPAADIAAALAQLIAGQREILDGQRDIRDELRALRGIGRAFDPKAANLLRAIDEWGAAMKVPHPVFSVRALFAYAEMIPDGKGLRAAMVAVDRFGELNGKRLGRFLLRIEGQDIDGLRVERLAKNDHGSALYVLRVSSA